MGYERGDARLMEQRARKDDAAKNAPEGAKTNGGGPGSRLVDGEQGPDTWAALTATMSIATKTRMLPPQVFESPFSRVDAGFANSMPEPHRGAGHTGRVANCPTASPGAVVWPRRGGTPALGLTRHAHLRCRPVNAECGAGRPCPCARQAPMPMSFPSRRRTVEPAEPKQDTRLDESLLVALGLNEDWWEPEFVLEIDLDLSECEPKPRGEA